MLLSHLFIFYRPITQNLSTATTYLLPCLSMREAYHIFGEKSNFSGKKGHIFRETTTSTLQQPFSIPIVHIDVNVNLVIQ